MRTTRAVITAAAPNQRMLPLQVLLDRDGVQKSVLRILVEEAQRGGIEEICVVLFPGDEKAYAEAVGEYSGNLHFVPQPEALGYGHAVYCAREFVSGEPFLHIIGDHIYSSRSQRDCVTQLLQTAQAHSCSVSAVQPTRENLLPLFGTVAGPRIKGTQDMYTVERVVEKPTPTEAEQYLTIPGLRMGHYLCFFGLHVLTPQVMEILEQHVQASTGKLPIQLSPVLAELATRERYLALEVQGERFPLDVRYGLLRAQLGLALSGCDREEVLAGLCEILAQHRQLIGSDPH